MPRGTINKKDNFQFSQFLWPKLSTFSRKGHFLPLNGRQDRQDFAQSCPRGWQRLTPKRSVGAIKLSDAVLKVWGNLPTLQGWLDSWGCLFPDRLKKQHIKINDQSAASCAVIENQQAMTKNHQKNHQKSPKITKNHQKPPKITKNRQNSTQYHQQYLPANQNVRPPLIVHHK